jgi:hypothetical protein
MMGNLKIIKTKLSCVNKSNEPPSDGGFLFCVSCIVHFGKMEHYFEEYLLFLQQSDFDWNNIQGCGQVLLFLFVQTEYLHCFMVSIKFVWCKKINMRAIEKLVNNLHSVIYYVCYIDCRGLISVLFIDNEHLFLA